MPGGDQLSVGVLGLGIIGTGVAHKLRADGHEVFVWNRTPKPEPNALGSPADAAAAAPVLQLFVRDGDALLEVLAAAAPALTPEHLVLAHATVAPGEMREAAEIAAAAGAAFLDCPFTGSRDAAAAGKLNYYVGGDAEVLERARPVLGASANSITHLGEVGAATVLKIATNMISATTVAILAEALAVAEKGGVDPAAMEAALAVNACTSGLVNMKLPAMLGGDYTPHFSLKNMFKDAQFGLAIGSAAGVDLPVLSSAAATMLEQVRAGRGEEDYAVVYERFAG